MPHKVVEMITAKANQYKDWARKAKYYGDLREANEMFARADAMLEAARIAKKVLEND